MFNPGQTCFNQSMTKQVSPSDVLSDPGPNTSGISRPIWQPRLATYMFFFVSGFLPATWAPLIPYLQSRLGANDAQLGMLLLCLGIGSLIAMPIAGGVAARRGAKPVMLAGGLVIALMLPIMVTATTMTVAALALLALIALRGLRDSQ